ncbi:NUDIX hydrolase [Bradyrhizobium sp. 141]|uniref:NUDIX hydrolase n=1 Tax=Bradyrhizobium sp. 141 TaxID=2782617 RepID=UPI001FF8F249|nr:NUDIX hydrolase [Bradyrhizobium sp. 141]MCK1721009.1 NUDIX domain-containing protein [Bradyrhizobium sp. 141]
MARAPVMAAGGIVLRRGSTPLIAVVRQRKRNEWVLPKGKLDDGETPKEAAHREVLEETGHDVAVHEFLGTLVYQSGGRSKVVHFWRMEAEGGPVRKLMNDIKAVDWLTLDDAIGRLSREYERVFLIQTGPIALAAAGLSPASEPEATPMRATDDLDAALRTLTPAEAASVDELRHGLLQKVKAWLRGEA